MGKPRSAPKKGLEPPSHGSLHAQLKEDVTGRLKPVGARQKQKRKAQAQEDAVLDADLSEKILRQAREQQQEERHGPTERGTPPLEARTLQGADTDDDEDDDFGPGTSGEEASEDYFEDLEIDEDDQAALDAFMPSSRHQPGVLADLIMEKIADFERTAEGAPAQQPLDAKVVEVYSKVGQLLARYRSGPLPKAFKILPTVPMWASLLELTKPDDWSPHATLAATKIFASNLDPKQSQRFYRHFLLPRVRDEIQETKKLSVHLYQALKKALYKPSAFFKGILLPLCESGTCTLREAAIIGSVVSKVSIPVLHSGAGLLKLSEMSYTGPNSLFIRILLDKKYALPYKVVDALVFHFMRFKAETRALPVLWHQSFLVFAQRYKSDITEEQRDALLDAVKVHCHPQIGPEIRRELTHGVARGAGQGDVEMDETW